MLKFIFILFLINSSLYAKVDNESRQLVKKLALLMVDKTSIEKQEQQIKSQVINSVLIRYSKQNRIAFMSESSQDLPSYLTFEKVLKSHLQKAITTEVSLYSFSLKMYSTVYLKYFNKNELKDLLAFYQSSTGKKFVKVNNSVMKGVQTRLTSYLNNTITALNEKLSKIAKSETDRFIKELSNK